MNDSTDRTPRQIERERVKAMIDSDENLDAPADWYPPGTAFAEWQDFMDAMGRAGAALSESAARRAKPVLDFLAGAR